MEVFPKIMNGNFYKEENYEKIVQKGINKLDFVKNLCLSHKFGKNIHLILAVHGKGLV